MYKIHYKITLNSGKTIEFDNANNKISMTQLLSAGEETFSGVCASLMDNDAAYKTCDGRLIVVKQSQIASLELTDCAEETD